MGISVVIMAFNERNSLEPVTIEIEGILKEIDRPYEIIIINDGSTDGTGELADSQADKGRNIRIIHHGVNRGLGGVYRSGFEAARGELVTFFPADGQFPASIIKGFVRSVEGVDMVLGYLPNRKSSLLAKSLSCAERFLFKAACSRLPKFQGVMMFRRELLDRFKLRSDGRGWTVLMELILRADKAGCKIVSIPTEMRLRMDGMSKVNNFRTAWDNLAQIMALARHI